MSYVAKDPDIRVAQVFQQKWEPLGIDGVIILTMKKGVITGGVTYGNTKRLCADYGTRLDELINTGVRP